MQKRPFLYLPAAAMICGLSWAQEPEKCPRDIRENCSLACCQDIVQEPKGQNAQDYRDSQGPKPKPKAQPGKDQDGTHKSNANIENYLKYLQEARVEQIKLRLGVSSERANAIATKWAEYEAPIRRIHIESMAVWRQMQFIIQEASPEREKSKKIKPLNDQYRELRRQLDEARQNLYRGLPMMGDSPIQQTRILFLMEEMERKEREGLRAFIEKRKKEKE